MARLDVHIILNECQECPEILAQPYLITTLTEVLAQAEYLEVWNQSKFKVGQFE